MFVLQRADIFPIGDLAAVNALKQVKKLPKDTPPEKLLGISAAWQPLPDRCHDDIVALLPVAAGKRYFCRNGENKEGGNALGTDHPKLNTA